MGLFGISAWGHAQPLASRPERTGALLAGPVSPTKNGLLPSPGPDLFLSAARRPAPRTAPGLQQAYAMTSDASPENEEPGPSQGKQNPKMPGSSPQRSPSARKKPALPPDAPEAPPLNPPPYRFKSHPWPGHIVAFKNKRPLNHFQHNTGYPPEREPDRAEEPDAGGRWKAFRPSDDVPPLLPKPRPKADGPQVDPSPRSPQPERPVSLREILNSSFHTAVQVQGEWKHVLLTRCELLAALSPAQQAEKRAQSKAETRVEPRFRRIFRAEPVSMVGVTIEDDKDDKKGKTPGPITPKSRWAFDVALDFDGPGPDALTSDARIVDQAWQGRNIMGQPVSYSVADFCYPPSRMKGWQTRQRPALSEAEQKLEAKAMQQALKTLKPLLRQWERQEARARGGVVRLLQAWEAERDLQEKAAAEQAVNAQIDAWLTRNAGKKSGEPQP